MQKLTLIAIVIIFTSLRSSAQDSPNILLIISDDLGADYSTGFHGNAIMPSTPTLDQLRSDGITFENAYATPVCTPTRAAIMSGKYGNKTGALGVPGSLDLSHESIFKAIENETNGLYADAVIGKWHIAEGQNLQHPNDHGLDFFTGIIGGAVQDYYSWPKVKDGQTSTSTNYITSDLTDEAINWISDQSSPWFLWLAHTTPHTPYHEPPEDLHTINNTNNNVRKYMAMVESLDSEIGRLLDNIPADQLENTLIIYIGDNGTANGILRNYPNGHGKGTVYQGGIRIPFIVSGAGVTRKGERESAMVHVVDIYATILEVIGTSLPGGRYNSLSFKHLLNGSDGPIRDYNYSEVIRNDSNFYAIRGPRYKVIESIEDNRQEFYDLLLDSLETNNLIGQITSGEVSAIKEDLEIEGLRTRNAWSCRDHIQNGDEEGIDCGGTYCAPCLSATKEINNSDKCFQISPNPVNDLLQVITENSGFFALTIRDLAGEEILNQEITEKVTTLELGGLPSGVYFIELIHPKSKEACVEKFVKID